MLVSRVRRRACQQWHLFLLLFQLMWRGPIKLVGKAGHVARYESGQQLTLADCWTLNSRVGT